MSATVSLSCSQIQFDCLAAKLKADPADIKEFTLNESTVPGAGALGNFVTKDVTVVFSFTAPTIALTVSEKHSLKARMAPDGVLISHLTDYFNKYSKG